MSARHQRTPTRYRLLWRTLPLWGLALVIGPLLVFVSGIDRAAQAHYQNGSFREAAEDFGLVAQLTPTERWKARFNHGTALFRSDRNWDALDALDRALDLVPDEHRCMVQTNRALVLEAQGDQDMEYSAESLDYAEQAQVFVDAGLPYPDDAPWYDATPEELYDDARMWAGFAEDMFVWAREAREDPACADSSQADDAQQEQNQQSMDRLEDKESEAAEAAADPADQEEEQPQPQDADEEERQRQQELDERNAEAEAEADADRQQRAGTRDPGGPGGGTGVGQGGGDTGSGGGTSGDDDGAGGSGGDQQGDGSTEDGDGRGDGEGDGYGGGTKNW